MLGFEETKFTEEDCKFMGGSSATQGAGVRSVFAGCLCERQRFRQVKSLKSFVS